MYYYHLHLELVTLALPDTPIRLFDDHLPPVLPQAIRQLKKTLPTSHHPNRSRHHHSKSRSKQTIATSTRPVNAPPTPIRSPKQAHSLRLTDRPDFRLGPVVIHSSTTSTTECGYGILHVFRDAASSHEEEEETKGPVYMSILAVPSYMGPAELLAFIGYKENGGCAYRMISDHSPNKYTAVFRFDTAEAADQLFIKYNGKRLCVTEPEICHVVYLRGEPVVDWMVIPSAKSPVSLHDTLQHDLQDDDTRCYELPTCPVCLERMDESVTGLKTIVCEHTFDCSCLSKWGESDCPVCRYSQKPVLDPGRPSGSSSSSSSSNGTITSLQRAAVKAVATEHQQDFHECFECGATDSLWICMVCGHIGCGRYQDAHAYDHYCETNHVYALEIETQHVWDYAGDGYVHRLIQNMVDGSLLELPSAAAAAATAAATSGASGASGGESDNRHPHKDAKGSAATQEKMDTMSVEYTYLLTSQLDSQRMYYEEQLEEMYHAIANLTAEARALMVDVDSIQDERETLIKTWNELDKQVAEADKEKSKAERRLVTWKAKAQVVEKEWKEEKEMTDSLMANHQVLQKEAEEKDKTIQALNEQIMQLMTRLEGPPTQQEETPSSDQAASASAGAVTSPSSPPLVSNSKKSKRGNRS